MPPAAVTVAEPVEAPLHSTFVCAVIEAVSWDGSVITTEVLDVQPFTSVAVTLYVPAVRPVAVAEVWPLFHKYVIVPVPPVPEAVAEPFEPPKQLTFTEVGIVTATALAGCIIVTVAVSVQPFESVTVTLWLPAESPVAVWSVEPLSHR